MCKRKNINGIIVEHFCQCATLHYTTPNFSMYLHGVQARGMLYENKYNVGRYTEATLYDISPRRNPRKGHLVPVLPTDSDTVQTLTTIAHKALENTTLIKIVY